VSRHVIAADGVLGHSKPEARDADQVRQARHHVPNALVDPGRAHPDEHLIVADGRLIDLPELQDVG
jgi:hypothetical protein